MSTVLQSLGGEYLVRYGLYGKKNRALKDDD